MTPFVQLTLTWDLFLDGETDFILPGVFSMFRNPSLVPLSRELSWLLATAGGFDSPFVIFVTQSSMGQGEVLPAPSTTRTLCFFFHKTKVGAGSVLMGADVPKP